MVSIMDFFNGPLLGQSTIVDQHAESVTDDYG
jgi:hypothetical protein